LQGCLCGGDVDSHVGGLCARDADGGAIVLEVRASALFECLGGWVEDSHACEIARCLTMRQYVKQTDKVSADSFRGRHVKFLKFLEMTSMKFFSHEQ
jgi:hypothetical protein